MYLPVYDEHRYFSAVFTGIENLFSHKQWTIKPLYFNLLEHLYVEIVKIH